MTSRERFHATIERRAVDRPAAWLGIPIESAVPALLAHFQARDLAGLKHALQDDVWPVEIPYRSAFSNAIYMAFDWQGAGKLDDDHRTLTAPGWFAEITDPKAVERFPWPEPESCIQPAACRAQVAAVPEDQATLGVFWSAHFQDACAAFGMETALMNMLGEPDMFRAVIDRITDFYLRANRIFLDATRGRLDAILIGNDFGSQTGLMLSRELIREFVFPGTRQLVEQAKSYGVKVIHHSCGAIHDLIGDLMGMGVDAVHPIQALAKNMDALTLKRDFGGRASFVGGVDAQHLLVRGSPEEIRAKVVELRALFPTGLVISPSHEAILPDVPPANIEALFAATRQQ